MLNGQEPERRVVLNPIGEDVDTILDENNNVAGITFMQSAANGEFCSTGNGVLHLKTVIICDPNDESSSIPSSNFIASNCTFTHKFDFKAGCGLPSNHDVDTSNIIYPLTIAEIQNFGSGNNNDGAANPFTLLSSSLIAIAAALTLN